MHISDGLKALALSHLNNTPCPGVYLIKSISIAVCGGPVPTQDELDSVWETKSVAYSSQLQVITLKILLDNTNSVALVPTLYVNSLKTYNSDYTSRSFVLSDIAEVPVQAEGTATHVYFLTEYSGGYMSSVHVLTAGKGDSDADIKFSNTDIKLNTNFKFNDITLNFNFLLGE